MDGTVTQPSITTNRVRNPILPGFHPDPSICRVGETFYIATSTFEWYPGVEINASENLQDWRLVSRPLNRESQLDMRGNPDSCGVWAPCLSYADGLFWLIYTDVKRYDGNYKDTHNYLVTAPTIEGPWSDPVYLNSSGFDPSLFHDEDGRKWFANMVWDHRADFSPRANRPFGGVVLQEYDPAAQKLIGPVSLISEGSRLGCTEAPHLFKRNDYYYLTLAEGGTGYQHAVSLARSRTIEGPYEFHPDIAVLTAVGSPHGALQRIGHGQYVEGPDGQGWHTFLCSRPLPDSRISPMGRETGIVKVHWGEDDWLYADDPQASPWGGEAPVEQISYQFDGTLPDDFQWLRTPRSARIFSLDAHPGALRLIGRESMGSWFEQALVARRQTAWCYSAQTRLDFNPRDFQTMAGLVAYYNRCQFHYLYLSRDDDGIRRIAIQCCNGDWPEAKLIYPVGMGEPVPDGIIELGLDTNEDSLQFRYRIEGGDWRTIGPVLDASMLSDEGGRGEHANFTGAFVGMAAQDLTGQGTHADFLNFYYETR